MAINKECRDDALDALSDVFVEFAKISEFEAKQKSMEILEHIDSLIEIDAKTLEIKLAARSYKRMVGKVKRHLVSIGCSTGV